MESHNRHTRSVAGSRLCPFGVVFFDRRGKNVRQLYRSKKTGTCLETVCPICDCKRRDHLRLGTDDGTVSDCTGSNQYHYENSRIWDSKENSAAG